MGEAFARGLLAAGVVPASDLRASVRTPERREALAALLGGYENVFGDALLGGARQVAETSDVIILSVKPAAAGKVLESLAPYLDVKRHLIVSIAAGIPLAAIESRLCRGAKVARVMPNTPTLVGSGTSVYCLNDEASNDRGDSSSSSSSSTSSSSPSPPAADVVRAMLEAVGLALPLDESLMDAATGLSGCGPAYVFLMIEALADGGVRAGLPRDVATRLAAATVGGAAQMVLEVWQRFFFNDFKLFFCLAFISDPASHSFFLQNNLSNDKIKIIKQKYNKIRPAPGEERAGREEPGTATAEPLLLCESSRTPPSSESGCAPPEERR